MKKRKNKMFTIAIFILAVFCTVYPISDVVKAFTAVTFSPTVAEEKITLFERYLDYQIKPQYLAEDAKVQVTSSNTKVAKIVEKTMIRPVKKGNATITVTIKQNKKTYTKKIAVTVRSPYIFINNKVDKVKVGEKYEFRINLMGSFTSEKGIKWSVSNEEIATITKSGKTALLIAKKPGKVKVLVKDTKKGTTSVCHITVTKERIPFEFRNPIETLWCDVDYELKVRGNLSSIRWSSSDESIATVTEDGIITGVKQGTVTIYATDTITEHTISLTIQTKKIEETSISDIEYEVVENEEYVYVKGVRDKTIKQLRIPEMIEGKPVRYLRTEALYDLENLEILVVPKTMRELTDSIMDLPKLESIVILNRDQRFGMGNFGLKNLKEYITPYKMEWSFPYYGSVSNVSTLKQLVLPEGSATSLDEIFSRCSNMEVVLPENFTKLEYGFTDCQNIRVVIPRGVTTIAEYSQVFADCTNVTIVTPRGSYAESYAKKYNLTYENYYD